MSLVACPGVDEPQESAGPWNSGPSTSSSATTALVTGEAVTEGNVSESSSGTTSGADTSEAMSSDASAASTPGTTTGTTTGATTGTTGTTTDTTTGTSGEMESMPMPVACDGKIYECGDGIDNDGDGAIDGGDLECTSPCDDKEHSFQTSLPGQAKDCKNDCFWDLESGVGNDGCEYPLSCDAQNPGAQLGCEFDEVCEATISTKCLNVCVPQIPNGCDCFGCCHVDTANGTIDIYLDSSDACSLANLGACEQCTFQEDCQNPCDKEACEICFGEQAPDEGCGAPSCAPGVMACTVDQNGVHACGEGFFCSTGCCYPIVPG